MISDVYFRYPHLGMNILALNNGFIHENWRKLYFGTAESRGFPDDGSPVGFPYGFGTLVDENSEKKNKSNLYIEVYFTK